jgi:hypothetical protein
MKTTRSTLPFGVLLFDREENKSAAMKRAFAGVGRGERRDG